MSDRYIYIYDFFDNKTSEVTHSIFQTVQSNRQSHFSRMRSSYLIKSYIFFKEEIMKKKSIIKLELINNTPEYDEDFGMAGFNLTFRYFNKEKQKYENIVYYISPYNIGDTCDIVEMDNWSIREDSPTLLDYMFQFNFDEIYSSIEKFIDMEKETLVLKSSIDIELIKRMCRQLSFKIDVRQMKAKCSFSLNLDTINRTYETKIKEQENKDKIKREAYLYLRNTVEKTSNYIGVYSIQFNRKLIIKSSKDIMISDENRFIDFDIDNNKINEFDEYLDDKLIELRVK